MRTHALVLCVTAMAAVAAVPAAAGTQPSPCETVLADVPNATADPGRQLADAIGDQREEIGTVLNDRWFDARLANASTTGERADIVASEADRIERELTALEGCWREVRTDPDSVAAETRRDPVAVLADRALVLDRRLNETASEARELPRAVRRDHDVATPRIRTLDRRIRTVRESLAAVRQSTDTPDR